MIERKKAGESGNNFRKEDEKYGNEEAGGAHPPGRHHRGTEVLKVDRFLNHQMDIALINEIGQEFYRIFQGDNVTKILTIEASGIGIACLTAQFFQVPVIFAKKNKTKNIAGDVYTSKVASFTHGRVYDIIVSKEFLGPEDRVLLIDDFLANGSALQGLINLVRDAGGPHAHRRGNLRGKGLPARRGLIRSMGVRVESLARVKSMDEATHSIEFC